MRFPTSGNSPCDAAQHVAGLLAFEHQGSKFVRKLRIVAE
jgi:hypothetical protein